MRKRLVLTTLGALLAIGVACALMLALPIAWDTAANNLRLERYSAAFRRLAHPSGSIRVDAQRQVGLLIGNGNHCNFFVGELRRFDGPPGDVATFYEGKTLGDIAPISVAVIEDGKFSDDARLFLPYRFSTLSAWSIPSGEGTDGLYVVFILLTEFEPGWDLRCG